MQGFVVELLAGENSLPNIPLFHRTALFARQYSVKMIEQAGHILPLIEVWGTDEFAEFSEIMGGEAAEVVAEMGILHLIIRELYHKYLINSILQLFIREDNTILFLFSEFFLPIFGT